MNLLQVPSDSEMVEHSVELSKAINDLGALTVMGGVFLTLVIVMFGFFIYQLVSQQKQLAAISKASEATTRYFTNKGLKAINLDQARSIVHLSFKRLQNTVIVQVLKLIQSKDKSDLHDKISLFLSNIQKEHKNYFNKFEFCGTPVSHMDDDSWMVEAKTMMENSIDANETNLLSLIEDYKILFDKYISIFDSKLTEAIKQ